MVCAAIFCLSGCNDDDSRVSPRPEVPPNMAISQIMEVEFTCGKLASAGQLEKNQVICHFKVEGTEYDQYQFAIKARVVRLRGKSRLQLDAPLPIGDIRILYIEYRGDRDLPDTPLRTFGLGYLLKVSENDVTVIGHFDEPTGLVGAGTEDDPYRINCADDLLILQGKVNKDNSGGLFKNAHFSQTCDIDMDFICNYMDVHYGWLPIGQTNTVPFRGQYHGHGWTISNLRIDRPEHIIGGLFGCLYGALVDSLHITNARITVDGVAGVVAGAAIAAGSDNAVGGTIVSSQVSHCTVTQSHIKSPVSSGMIVGMADAYSRLMVNDCQSDASNVLVTEYGAGGIVGIGAFKSSVALYNNSNNTPVSGTMGSIGGIIGTSDTLLAVNCVNHASITLRRDGADERHGTGGIAGGTGCGQFVNCENNGVVTGDRGTGGILGSALLDKGEGTVDDPGIYNSALLSTCVNRGAVTGTVYTGGICGEAQVSAISCANSGKIRSDGGYAGGIVGNSPAMALLDCLNNGEISGGKLLGGMTGLAIFGTGAFCVNFGKVNSTGGNAGGIAGLGGGGMLLHYCGNYADIIGKDGPTGGICGELGKVRKWEGTDIASVIFGALSIVGSVSSIATASAFHVQERKAGQTGGTKDIPKNHPLKIKIKKADISFKVIDGAMGAVNVILAGFDINARVNPTSPWTEVRKAEVQAAATERAASVRDSLFNQAKGQMAAYSFTHPASLRGDLMTGRQAQAYADQSTALAQSDTQLNTLNDNIDLRRANLEAEADDDKALRDRKFDILNAVLAAVSLVLMIASIPLTGGAGLAVGIVSSAVGMVSGASSIGKSVMNYQVNATEISQCFNYGKVSGNGGETGGIVGLLNDYGHVYDCYNAGAVFSSGSAGLIAGDAGNQTVLCNSLNLWNGPEGSSSITGKHAENPKRIEHNHSTRDESLDKLAQPGTYAGWDFQSVWQSPGADDTNTKYILPTLNTSEYAK